MEFRILGPLEVLVEGRALSLPRGKQRILLALLLLRANELVSADRLIGELWQGDIPDTAANTLQVYVSRLRKLIGPAVEHRGGGYVLRVDAEAIDAARFRRFVAQGRVHDAVALWRGPALADVELPATARIETERLEEERLLALEQRVDEDLAGGRHAELVPELEALVGENPLRERLRAQHMLALYRSGRQAEALEVYRRGRETLVEELGIEPGPELQELERSILRHDAELALALPPPRLPAPTTAIVGRERELEELVALLRDPGVRLLTLTGPGGIGKTRLALEAARLLAPELGNEVAFVPLAAVRSAEPVASAIAQALDLPLGAGEPLAAVTQRVRERPSLLVLDNFEQIVEAAPIAGELLAAAPLLKVLVTSRETLRLSGEHELVVPPLGTAPAFSLFVERARAADRAFAVTEQSAPAVAEICTRLEGLPLAIELAAARSKLLPPPALLERLGNRLDVLAGGARDAPQRQQTLRATIDWSYGLLDAGDQELFARLAVFAGGCTLESAEAVAAADLEGLASLVGKSLLRRERDVPRFSMLETVREYALERLATSDEQSVRDRHARHYLELARNGSKYLTGPEQKPWLERLETEHENLRTAYTYLVAHDPPAALALVSALVWFWRIHGHLAEGLRAIEETLARTAAVRSLERATALNGAGILLGEQGEYERARPYFEAARELGREIGDREREGVALVNLGNLEVYTGDFAAARRSYEEALEIWDEIGHKRREGITYGNLGDVYLAEGDAEGALEYLERSARVAVEVGDRHQEGLALRDRGRAFHILGRIDQARADFEASLALMVEFGERHGVADCLEGLAATAREPASAGVLLGAADAVRAAIGARRPGDQQAWYEGIVAGVTDALGAARFAEELERGRALPLEQALELAGVHARERPVGPGART